METVANTTVTWHPLNGSFSLIEEPPTIVVAALLSVTIWIIFSNLLILVCLVVSQHALKHCANLQILSLSITDMCTGVFALLLTLSYKITASFPTFEACATMWYGYSTSQAASLFYALGICIHRLLIIKRRTSKTDVLRKDIYKDIPKDTCKRMLMETILIWIISAVIVAVPFVSYGQFGKELKECSYENMFEEKSRQAAVIICVVYLIPQGCMTAVYVYIIKFLLTKWRQTNITTPPTTGAASYSSKVNPDGSDQLPAFQPSCSTKIKTASLKTDSKNISNDNSVDIPQTSILRPENAAVVITPLGTGVKCDKPSYKRNSDARINRHSYRRQIHALVTIGLVILVMNICITPFYCMGIIMTMMDITIKRSVRAVVICVSFMNSALNPIIYALRIKPFRKVLTVILNKCGSYLSLYK